MTEAGLSIADHLVRSAARTPGVVALITPKRHLTLQQLDEQSTICGRGLLAAGLRPGQRAVVMLRPGVDFVVVTFGLFKMGAVPVFVDPGMGWKSLKACLDEAAPHAFIGIPLAQLARIILGWARKSVDLTVTAASPVPLGRGVTLARVQRAGAQSSGDLTQSDFDSPAAIAFTSGSTGQAKGVLYTHRMFAHQIRLLRDTFGIEPGEVDLATFPLFALFDPALGATTVFPQMDFTRPGTVDPRRILEPIQRHGVTHVFGSPALLKRVAGWAEREGLTLTGVRRVLSAGAPVPRTVILSLRRLLADGADIHTPYGATEALPVCSISGAELAAETASGTGRGVCVGRPLNGVDLHLIRISDDPVPEWDPQLEVAPGEVGEIVVGGDNVSQGYHRRPAADLHSKIRHGRRLLHRMGDLGYRDLSGRLWFCGRKSQRVVAAGGTLFTVCCEGVFNQHPAVFRSALIGLGSAPEQEPVLCVELEDGVEPSAGLSDEILALGAADPQTSGIRRLLFHPGFPVDIRHNAKIFREKLAVWAEGKSA